MPHQSLEDQIAEAQTHFSAERARLAARRQDAALRAHELRVAKQKSLEEAQRDDAWRAAAVKQAQEQRLLAHIARTRTQELHAQALVHQTRAERRAWQQTQFELSVHRVETAAEKHAAAVYSRAVSAAASSRAAAAAAAARRQAVELEREARRAVLQQEEKARAVDAERDAHSAARRAASAQQNHLAVAARTKAAAQQQLAARREQLEVRVAQEEARSQAIALLKQRELAAAHAAKQRRWAEARLRSNAVLQRRQQRAEDILAHFDDTVARGALQREANRSVPPQVSWMCRKQQQQLQQQKTFADPNANSL